MLKKITSILLLTSLVSVAEITYLTKAQIETLSKSSTILSNSYTRIIEGIDENDTYFLDVQYKGKNKHFFVNKKTGVIYRGLRFDSTGKVSKFIKSPERLKHLTDTIQNGISLSYGTGKKDLYIFTDPECPYCKRFEQQAKGLLDEYTVHIILFPLRFHKKAPAMTEWILEGKDNKEKYTRMEDIMIHNDRQYVSLMGKQGKSFRYSTSVQQILRQGQNAARALHVTGTPSVFDSQFNKINWGKLLQKERSKKEALQTIMNPINRTTKNNFLISK